jgi:hypothetical protein
MSKLHAIFLALLLALPAWSWGQQGAPPPATDGQNQSLPDPVLSHRPPPRPPALRSAATPEGRIHLDVLVTDAAGKPAVGLAPSAFTLLDDNQPRKILSFRSFDGVAVKPAPPVEVILIIDAVNNGFTELGYIRAGLGVRLSKVLADGDSGASDWRKPELVVESAA